MGHAAHVGTAERRRHLVRRQELCLHLLAATASGMRGCPGHPPSVGTPAYEQGLGAPAIAR